MTRWWWVRHGPTHEKAFVGWRDVPADLSDRDQIDRLSAYLPANALVVSSDLIRAVATADAIARGRQRLAHARELREFDFGEWDGLGFAEVAARDAELSRAFWEKPGDVAPPGGESWNQVAARVRGFVQTVNTRYGGRDIVAVAHIGVIMTQIHVACGDAEAALAHSIDNLSVTRLRHENDRWHLEEVNRLP